MPHDDTWNDGPAGKDQYKRDHDRAVDKAYRRGDFEEEKESDKKEKERD